MSNSDDNNTPSTPVFKTQVPDFNEDEILNENNNNSNSKANTSNGNNSSNNKSSKKPSVRENSTTTSTTRSSLSSINLDTNRTNKSSAATKTKRNSSQDFNSIAGGKNDKKKDFIKRNIQVSCFKNINGFIHPRVFESNKKQTIVF